MKTLNIPLEDEEFKELGKSKGDLSWHDFILTLINKSDKQNG